MSSPIFTCKTVFNSSKPPTLNDVHPWMVAELKSNVKWMVNPDHPHSMEFKDDTLTSLECHSFKGFSPGDLIWVSFTLSFVIGPKFWSPEYRPMDLVRVGHLNKPEARRSGLELEIAEVRRKPLVISAKIQLPSGLSCCLLHFRASC
jgi:hypothetical protein